MTTSKTGTGLKHFCPARIRRVKDVCYHAATVNGKRKWRRIGSINGNLIEFANEYALLDSYFHQDERTTSAEKLADMLWKQIRHDRLMEYKRQVDKDRRHSYRYSHWEGYKNRTPRWANNEAIRRFYRKAEKLTKLTGIPHEVDHIIPLRGRRVSGLHVASNLRVVTREENRRKSNNFIVDSAVESGSKSRKPACG